MDVSKKSAIFAPRNISILKKMNFINKALALTLLVIMTMIASVSVAQNLNPSNLTGSPYTRYGYGNLGSLGNTATKGMGDVGIAIRTNNYTTLANPASLTAIDTLTMIFSTGLDADFVTYSEGSKADRNWNAGLSNLCLHFPLWRNFAMSLSLSPYSTVGYSYGGTEYVPLQSATVKHDTLTIAREYEGVGGVNNFMMGVGYRPFHTKMQELSLGVNAGYLFGTIEHDATVLTSSQANSTYISHELTIRGLFLKLGAQYTRRLNATRAITIGATFQPQLNLSVDADELKLSVDTIQPSTEKYRSLIKSPMRVGAGITYNVVRKLTVSAEYEFEKWSAVNSLNSDNSLASGLFYDTHRFAVGAEYIPRANSNRLWHNIRYRGGLSTKNSYMKINNATLRHYSVTAGASIPVNRRCFLDFSVGYNHLQPSDKSLVKEDYLNLSLGVTFNEMMFFRNKLR